MEMYLKNDKPWKIYFKNVILIRYKTNLHEPAYQPENRSCLCKTNKIHPQFLIHSSIDPSFSPSFYHQVSLSTLALDDSNKTAIQWAVYHGRAELVEFLLQITPDRYSKCITNLTTTNKETALSFAASRGYFRLVEMLVEKGKANCNPEVDWNGGTPLLYAVQKAYPQIVDFLIRNGARITDCGDYDAYDLALELKHFSCADVIEKILLSSYSL